VPGGENDIDETRSNTTIKKRRGKGLISGLAENACALQKEEIGEGDTWAGKGRGT